MPDLIIGAVWVGDKFGEEYLVNLHAMLRRHVKLDFIFYVITDRDVTETIVKLHGPWAYHVLTEPAQKKFWGWWHFMHYYDSIMGRSRRRIYFGLDTIIRADITEEMKRTEYTLSKDFGYLIEDGAKLFANTWADCAAIIPIGGMPWLYDEFLNEHNRTGIGGAQYPMHVWVTNTLRQHGIKPELWQDVAPDFLCSYKWPDVKREEPKEKCVFFHGPPMIHEALADSPWISNHWHSKDL